jgi:hypothetical protein
MAQGTQEGAGRHRPRRPVNRRPLMSVFAEEQRLCLVGAGNLTFVALAIFGIFLVAGRALGADHRFDGVYSGERLLIKGSGSTCPAKENVSINIHGQTLTFTNSALKKFAIIFNPEKDGSFGETYEDEGGDTAEIRGRITGNAIDANVTNYGSNPPCEHHWHLKKE